MSNVRRIVHIQIFMCRDFQRRNESRQKDRLEINSTRKFHCQSFIEKGWKWRRESVASMSFLDIQCKPCHSEDKTCSHYCSLSLSGYWTTQKIHSRLSRTEDFSGAKAKLYFGELSSFKTFLILCLVSQSEHSLVFFQLCHSLLMHFFVSTLPNLHPVWGPWPY